MDFSLWKKRRVFIKEQSVHAKAHHDLFAFGGGWIDILVSSAYLDGVLHIDVTGSSLVLVASMCLSSEMNTVSLFYHHLLSQQ